MSFDQTDNLIKKDGEAGAQSAQSKLQNEATEHTLAGAAIGIVRDVIPGLRGTASSNDQIAQIAADTVASLPMVKTVVGGALRATMLIDPTKGFESNVGGFGVNFLEGAALNKVSRLAMPESGFTASLQSRFGAGLATEAATHLTTGFGFGAIRTGFNSESWKDSSGNFDLQTGAENLIRGGTTGALINLPAGMVGLRVARASSVALESSIVSPRIASTLANIGSGYAAGGVYGGVDAVMAGGNFSQFLKGINDGGLIGAATGGAIGAFDKSPISARVGELRRNPSATEHESMVGKSNAGRKEELAASVERTDASRIPSEPERAKKWHEGLESENSELTGRLAVSPLTYDRLSIEAREVPRIVDYQDRLTSYTVRSETHDAPVPGAKGPWKDYDDFRAQALKHVTQDYRVYKFSDGVETEIAIPESYAKQLDEIRKLRIKAEQPSPLDDLPKGHSIAVQNMVKNNDVAAFRGRFDEETAKKILPVVSARNALAAHPLGNRALPEDILALLDEQPSKEKINRINIYPDESPLNPWYEHFYNEDSFTAAASASESQGLINFFGANKSDMTNSPIRDNLRSTFTHERGHIYTPSDHDYRDASLLDKDRYYVSKYSRKNDSERWSEDNAKGFLVPDVDQFLAFAENAPVRAVVMAREIEKQIENAPHNNRGLFTDDIINRIKFVEQEVTPLAREQLAQQLSSKDVEMQQAALRLLKKLATKEELPAVMQAAYRSESPDVRKNAFALAVALHGPDFKERFDFVWDEAQPFKPAREEAIQQMRYFGHINENASSYANLLEAAGQKNLSSLAMMVNRMFTDEGSVRAYELAMKMGAHEKGFQRAVALSALVETPSLRLRALQTLNNQPPEGIASVVRRFVNDKDPEVAKMAQDVLRGVELRLKIADMQRLIEKTGAVDPRVIEALGASGDNRSIAPLVQVVVRGSDASRALAVDALAKFDPNLVKFQARLAKQGHTSMEMQNLKYVLDYNHTMRPNQREEVNQSLGLSDDLHH